MAVCSSTQLSDSVTILLQRVYGSVGDAVGDMTRVYATTARLRGETSKEYMDLRTAASDAISVGKSEGGQACVMFGPESSGLTNDDCEISIP